jgi:uncharacterized membrane protein YkoI
MKILLSAIVLSGLVFLFGATANAQQKKIGMQRAQAIASKHAPGLKLKAKELEKEKGKWIYSFEFRDKRGSTREVNVDAFTGKVVGIEHESPKKEAKEQD